MSQDYKEHWNTAYHKNKVSNLGWYEEDPDATLQLIQQCGLSKDARLLNVGVGASTLLDKLIIGGYKNIIANDLSSTALGKLKKRLGAKEDGIQWIVDDLTKPTSLSKIEPVDLWNDRAVIHFFTEEKDQNTYFSLLNKLVKPNGYVIISAFNTDGATMCSGLPVFRYNKEMLIEKLGSDYSLIESFDYTYTMPSGDTRPYIYTLFKRIK